MSARTAKTPRPIGQAQCLADGERQATDYLARLRAQQASPDDLALIVAALYGATLRGFCRALAKELGAEHA